MMSLLSFGPSKLDYVPTLYSHFFPADIFDIFFTVKITMPRTNKLTTDRQMTTIIRELFC